RSVSAGCRSRQLSTADLLISQRQRRLSKPAAIDGRSPHLAASAQVVEAGSYRRRISSSRSVSAGCRSRQLSTADLLISQRQRRWSKPAAIDGRSTHLAASAQVVETGSYRRRISSSRSVSAAGRNRQLSTADLLISQRQSRLSKQAAIDGRSPHLAASAQVVETGSYRRQISSSRSVSAGCRSRQLSTADLLISQRQRR